MSPQEKDTQGTVRRVAVGEMCFVLEQEHSECSLCAITTALQVCEIQTGRGRESSEKTVKVHRD